VAEAGAVFDTRADGYDTQFSATATGARMRAAVWRRCDARFRPGVRVLEMNCGTGEDALYLARRGVEVLATDASSAMLRIAAEKIDTAGLRRRIELRQLAWEDLAHLEAEPFDGAFSNFGGLNCVEDLASAARALGNRLKPGAIAMLCIMGPVVPWEWMWFLLRGKPGQAFRRLKGGGARWRGLTIRYPSVRNARAAFGRDFRLLRVSALGALLPPPFAENWVQRHKRLLDVLDRMERQIETVWPLPWLADHYVLELERT
jgi:SAM-dependent methyltransferase